MSLFWWKKFRWYFVLLIRHFLPFGLAGCVVPQTEAPPILQPQPSQLVGSPTNPSWPSQDPEIQNQTIGRRPGPAPKPPASRGARMPPCGANTWNQFVSSKEGRKQTFFFRPRWTRIPASFFFAPSREPKNTGPADSSTKLKAQALAKRRKRGAKKPTIQNMHWKEKPMELEIGLGDQFRPGPGF